MEKSLVDNKPNDPSAEPCENYENLPFHGLQNPPTKVSFRKVGENIFNANCCCHFSALLVSALFSVPHRLFWLLFSMLLSSFFSNSVCLSSFSLHRLFWHPSNPRPHVYPTFLFTDFNPIAVIVFVNVLLLQFFFFCYSKKIVFLLFIFFDCLYSSISGVPKRFLFFREKNPPTKAPTMINVTRMKFPSSIFPQL